MTISRPSSGSKPGAWPAVSLSGTKARAESGVWETVVCATVESEDVLPGWAPAGVPGRRLEVKRLMHGLLAGLVLFLFSAACPVHADLNDNGDGTVTDTGTGLMWLQESHPQPGSTEPLKTWKGAMIWAYALDYAGHTDWRLPSALETTSGVPDLLWNSVNNEWGHLYGVVWGNPAYTSDIAPMSNYPCCWYWTSTEDPGNSGRAAAFFVSYDNLWLNELQAKSTQMRYTAVRGAPKPAKAPECSDGYDNDSNGAVDYPDDVGCSSAEDDTELTCTGLLGFFGCGPQSKYNTGICFKIEDSTVCLEGARVIVGMATAAIASVGFGYWWSRRKKKGD